MLAQHAPHILVIDDHPIFRVGLASSLRGMFVGADVQEAIDVTTGLERWRAGRFDLITIDLSLPNGGGFALLRQARAEGLEGRALIVSMHDDPAYHERARTEGASGYVAKSSPIEVLCGCARRCLEGEEGFVLAHPPALVEELPLSQKELERAMTLTPTERRVLRMVGRRLTSREAALALNVSVRTVENHRANVCRKLHLRGPHRLLELALSLAQSGALDEVDDGA
jgi:DNA-binding NarL/FixJ family response regulator